MFTVYNDIQRIVLVYLYMFTSMLSRPCYSLFVQPSVFVDAPQPKRITATPRSPQHKVLQALQSAAQLGSGGAGRGGRFTGSTSRSTGCPESGSGGLKSVRSGDRYGLD